VLQWFISIQQIQVALQTLCLDTNTWQYCHVTNNNGFWIGWLDIFVHLYNDTQLQSLITAHNRWLPKARCFIPGLRASSLPLWLASWFPSCWLIPL
jgi:hypothetical protein